MTSLALAVIATGDPYRQLARVLAASARLYFAPCPIMQIIMLTDSLSEIPEGVTAIYHPHEPWPGPTLNRYRTITKHAAAFAPYDYLFYCDADMLFVAPVGSEILAPTAATLHPGYVMERGTYETRPESSAYVAPHEGTAYYCGAFQGGETSEYLALAARCRDMVESDAAKGITAVWNDESYWNRVMIDTPPHLTLSPSYCYPDDVPDYYESRWPERYTPFIKAIASKERHSCSK